MVFPEIFDGIVMAVFTDRETGVDISPLTNRPIYTPRQEHTDTIVDIGEDLAPMTGDAVFTRRHDIMVGVKTADCVPVLLFDWDSDVVGAVHAGWRGTASGILRKSIMHMADKYGSSPARMLVAIGPAIKGCCYEVGQDVLDKVIDATGDGDYHRVKDDNTYIDLQEANRKQALDAGVADYHISVTEDCTCCMNSKYNSYRYNKAGARQGGFIGMP